MPNSRLLVPPQIRHHRARRPLHVREQKHLCCTYVFLNEKSRFDACVPECSLLAYPPRTTTLFKTKLSIYNIEKRAIHSQLALQSLYHRQTFSLKTSLLHKLHLNANPFFPEVTIQYFRYFPLNNVYRAIWCHLCRQLRPLIKTFSCHTQIVE